VISTNPDVRRGVSFKDTYNCQRGKDMTQVKNMLLGTAFVALTTSAFAQTAQPAQPGDAGTDASGQASMQVAPVRPPQQNLVAPGPTDPLVQKRNDDARANAEYRASKKASKDDLKASQKAAKAQYKEQIRNAKINKKADKQAASNELNSSEPDGPKDTGLQH
jgi:hypothetical protein